MITGRILNIQRLSTEDGPGIRTTVFFKGCPLHCAWCHNPESISSLMQLQWFAVRCINCQTCVDTCPHDCLSMTEEGLMIDRLQCDGCGKCARECPSTALEMIGKSMSVDELLAELLKDRVYYEKSGGGVTLSGGEPTFQPDFSEALLRGLKESGISTALDTCGLTSARTIDRLLAYTDLILFDLKLIDPILHEKFTGVSNTRILENLVYIRDTIHRQKHPVDIWIRTPLIPGATDADANISAIGRLLADQLDGVVSRWELCAFNNLCRDQYVRLGMEWEYASTPLLKKDELLHCERVAKSSGLSPHLILATGATLVEASL
jgi:pyruvate formate lyase activating enzyme